MEVVLNNKLIILYILKMIKEGSSKNNPITQSTIERALKIMGFKCGRKTVASHINALIQFGYNIVKIPGGGCYLDEN